MEGRVLLRCGECQVTREIVGEIPGEYTDSFLAAVRLDGWVPRPPDGATLICGACLTRDFAGHESVDDEAKVAGTKDPKAM
jgi:hypothetical protein